MRYAQALIKEKQVSAPDVFISIQEKVDKLLNFFSCDSTDDCLIHFDLHGKNIIYDADNEHTYLIDWDYGCIGNRFLDLATFVLLFGLNNNAEKIILQRYLGTVKPLHRAKLYLAKIVVLIYRSSCDLCHPFYDLHNRQKKQIFPKNAIQDFEALEKEYIHSVTSYLELRRLPYTQRPTDINWQQLLGMAALKKLDLFLEDKKYEEYLSLYIDYLNKQSTEKIVTNNMC